MWRAYSGGGFLIDGLLYCGEQRGRLYPQFCAVVVILGTTRKCGCPWKPGCVLTAPAVEQLQCSSELIDFIASSSVLRILLCINIPYNTAEVNLGPLWKLSEICPNPKPKFIQQFLVLVKSASAASAAVFTVKHTKAIDSKDIPGFPG